jgi:hypothetical protein
MGWAARIFDKLMVSMFSVKLQQEVGISWNID